MALSKINSNSIQDGIIEVADVADNAITTAKLADANVTTAKVATDAITTAKIADANVTVAKLESTLDLTGKTVSLNSPTISGNTAFDTSTLYINASDNRVGIGTSSPNSPLEVSGTAAPMVRVTNTGVGSAYMLFQNADSGSTASDGLYVGLGAGEEGYMWNYEPDHLVFGTNNTERMRIDSSGNVGIGTSSPATKLHILDSTNASLSLTEDGSSGAEVAYNGTSNRLEFRTGTTASTGQTLRMWMPRDSAELIIPYSASYRSTFGVNFSRTIPETNVYARIGNGRAIDLGATTDGTSGLLKCNYQSATNSGDAANGNNRSLTIECQDFIVKTDTYATTSSSERMRINDSGYVMINTTSSSLWGGGVNQQLGVQGRIVTKHTGGDPFLVWRTDTGGLIAFSSGSTRTDVGSISTNGSTTSYNTTSDYRLKENNVNITDGIDRLKLLKSYRFNFITEPDRTVDGFYAHEVQSVVPEAISGTKDAVDDDGNPVYQGIDQSKLVPLLTAALQEAITKIEDLEARIATLENK